MSQYQDPHGDVELLCNPSSALRFSSCSGSLQVDGSWRLFGWCPNADPVFMVVLFHVSQNFSGIGFLTNVLFQSTDATQEISLLKKSVYGEIQF